MEADVLNKKIFAEWPQTLPSLLARCQRRFVRAAQLLEINDSEIRRVRDASQVDIRPLLEMYLELCDRYVKEVHTPQIDLFKNKDPIELWRTYFYHTILPNLVENDDVVRNVLKATEILPSAKVGASMMALVESAKCITLEVEGYQPDPRKS